MTLGRGEGLQPVELEMDGEDESNATRSQHTASSYAMSVAISLFLVVIAHVLIDDDRATYFAWCCIAGFSGIVCMMICRWSSDTRMRKAAATGAAIGTFSCVFGLLAQLIAVVVSRG